MEIYIGNINDYSIQYLAGLVSESHVEKSMKYRFEADQKRTLLAHALLDHALSNAFPDIAKPCDPVVDENGKPHIYPYGNEFYFSLSHSGDHAICAVGSCCIGADIEMIRDDKEKIADRFFADEERGYVKDAASFYMIWTLKESFMKAVGLGMQLPMDSFSVCDLDESTGICRFKPCKDPCLKDFLDKDGRYYMMSGIVINKIPGYSLACALNCSLLNELKTVKISFPKL